MKKRLTLHEKAVLAMKEAVKDVIRQHKKDGRRLAIWEDNRVKMILPK